MSHREVPVMTTETVTMNLSPEAAEVYKNASPEERRRLELLVSLQLLVGRKARPLKVIMDEVGKQAMERGITPEILEELLRDA